jgi:uncharacterized RDD family membrane protein YckC
VRYAGVVSRTLAFLADMAILAVLIAGTDYVVQQLAREVLGTSFQDIDRCAQLTVGWRRTHLCHLLPFVGPVVLFTYPPLYSIGFWTIGGQTPGMAILGLRVLRTDGRPVGLVTALVRFVGFLFPLLTFVISFFTVLGTKRRQAFHDLIARTVVVYDWLRSDPPLPVVGPGLTLGAGGETAQVSSRTTSAGSMGVRP